MVPTSVSCVLAGILAAVPADAPQRPRAVARVLELRGSVTATPAAGEPRKVACFGTVYAEERLRLAAGASLVLAFRGDGHLESIQGAAEVTVREAGCQPASAVKLLPAPRGSRPIQARIVDEAFPVTVLGAAVLRGTPEGLPRWRQPIPDSVQPNGEPLFAWTPSVEGSSYELTVVDAAGQVLWRNQGPGCQRKYSGEHTLRPGGSYRWEVRECPPGGAWTLACAGEFSVATAEQAEAAQAAGKLAATEAPGQVCLAALWFKEQRMWDEALRAAERLVRLAPQQAAYFVLLSEVLEVAERQRDAQQAWEKAQQLERAASP